MYTFIVLDNIEFYEVLKYRLDKFELVEKFFTEWNIKYFLKEGIFVTTPANLEYIQFNFNPEQEIELEHHEID